MVDIKFLNDTDTLFLIVILETIIIFGIFILYLVNRESGQDDKYKDANYHRPVINHKKDTNITQSRNILIIESEHLKQEALYSCCYLR